MTDQEIKQKLAPFAEVWKRVSGTRPALPENLQLMPGKKKHSRCPPNR